MWTPSHTDIAGNKKAYILAKEAITSADASKRH